jgi:ribosomal protein S14
MISIKLKDIKYRQQFYQKELLKLRLKFLFKNLITSSILREDHENYSLYLFLFSRLNRVHSSKVKVSRRCILTNRSRTSIRKFGISRILFREMLQFGIIPGYTKAVW